MRKKDGASAAAGSGVWSIRYIVKHLLRMKNVIVTGANGNLGQAVTGKLLESGYRVHAVVRKESSRNELEPHPQLIIHTADLSDEKAAHVAAEKILSQDQIHAVCLVAGGFAAGDIPSTTGDQLRLQLSQNFESAFYLCTRVLPHMLTHQYGRILFIGSRPALEATAGRKMADYGLSKSLLFKLAEYINAEGKSKNVTAAVIVPGTIDTPPNREAMPDADFSKWVSPEALADIMHMVISDLGDPLREVVL